MRNHAGPSSRRRAGQSGEGKIGCIFWLLVLGVAAMAAFKMVPVRMASAELL